ncbi:cyclic nucleotide-binding domain-containing protein [Caenimonas sedimenti]|uniref:Cyclic nucleotide-binding domain-containing protein n=1 Tax=Caenimonas sedimenti TaxID=2596921 RepID=A0A562ZXR9_9BURK|nr:cyclic nucleotide-binding domain-containing protein [Caenimonas sedimenti]TWO73409.1 cyclic nucleotide-binding domain-containing protein [Caenimonas sedimenti]
MLAQLFTHLKKVHRASTREELDAIYRFRYRVYVEELNRQLGGVDSERRMVTDIEDEKPYSHHFYVGSPADLEGVVRVRVWEPKQMPEAEAKKYSPHLLGPAEGRLRTAEVGRYMIDPKRRGSLVLPSMARVTYEFLAGEANVDISFCYCRPGLLDYYRRLGARTYGAGSFEGPEGVELPLLSVLSDDSHYKRVGSPMAPWARKHFGRGKRDPVDMSDFAHLFQDDVQQVVTDGRDVWDQFSAALNEFPDGQGFLEGLPEGTLRLLMRNGFVMDVPEGRLITREGNAERELYIVLDGEVEVFRGNQIVSTLGKGEVFGEMAFFRTEGRRWASVRATRPSRIAALRRRWMDDLGRSDPEGARAILFNLARVLAERAAAATVKEPGAAAAAG